MGNEPQLNMEITGHCLVYLLWFHKIFLCQYGFLTLSHDCEAGDKVSGNGATAHKTIAHLTFLLSSCSIFSVNKVKPELNYMKQLQVLLLSRVFLVKISLPYCRIYNFFFINCDLFMRYGLSVCILKEIYSHRCGTVVVQFRKPEIHTLLTVNSYCITPGKYISQCFVNTLNFTKMKKCVFLSLYLQGYNPSPPAIQTPARKHAALPVLVSVHLEYFFRNWFYCFCGEKKKNLKNVSQPTQL